MDCALSAETAWPALLQARALLQAGVRALAFVDRGNGWACEDLERFRPGDVRQVVFVGADVGPTDHLRTLSSIPVSTLSWTDDGMPEFRHERLPADAAMLTLLRVYVPVLLGDSAARGRGGVFVVGHVTQTLDGRIACANRTPQWIGNAADHRHAHRMRALCDAVMVGASAALGDDPRLTVRDVPGPQPRRIVLSGNGSVLRTRRRLHLFTDHGCEVVTRANVREPAPDGARRIDIDAPCGGVPPAAILTELAARGVHSIYLEGGARTLSSFLAEDKLDLLQVHIAPIVLGSGLTSFDLPEVATLHKAHAFAMQHAMLDGDVLLSCRPRRQR
jgi:5-amino-6-(5-phosphoribosylamino)uracil reductase/diaminohydroxyphosphoribosylaminopyrimidine deaminase/5-amino-6-(5-phosphoribosylamino)uracil reductase